MQRAIRPNIIVALDLLRQRIRESIRGKFTSFFNKRLVDTGLAVRTSEFNYVLGNSGSSSHRRSVSKLKSLILKALEKNSPYTAFLKSEFFNGTETDAFTIKLGATAPSNRGPELDLKALNKIFPTVKMKSVITARELASSGWELRMTTQFSKGEQSLRRYARYLGYLAIKNNIPIIPSFQMTPVWSEDNGSKQGLVSFTLELRFQIFGWCIRPSKRAEYEDMAQRGTFEDHIFNSEFWEQEHLGDMFSGTGLSHSSGNNFHISNLFLHLEDVLKVFNIALRKAEYDHHAFSFRAS